MKRILFLLVGLGILFGFAWHIFSPKEIKVIKEEISFKQAVGQVLLIGFKGTVATSKLKTLMQKIQPGGILLLGRNIQDKEQLQFLIQDLQDASKIPLFVAVDQEGGVISRIPWVENTSQSALESFEHAFLVGERRGKELRNIGINMNLGPVLDSVSFEDFLFERTFQENEVKSAKYARNLISGQKESDVISVLKHYPGYGGIIENPELQTIPLSPEFPDTGIFELLFSQTATPFLMLSHVIYRDIDKEQPLVLSSAGMKKVREGVGNEKIILSDDLLSEALLNAYELKELGIRAMYSGVDILLVAGYPDASIIEQFYDEFLLEAKKDDILKEHIRRAAAKVLAAKKEFLEP